MNDESVSILSIDNIQSIMDEKQSGREKLQKEWCALYEAQRIYYAAARKHHEFDNEKDLKEAMRHNFNPFDTFSVNKRKKK